MYETVEFVRGHPPSLLLLVLRYVVVIFQLCSKHYWIMCFYTDVSLLIVFLYMFLPYLNIFCVYGHYFCSI